MDDTVFQSAVDALTNATLGITELKVQSDKIIQNEQDIINSYNKSEQLINEAKLSNENVLKTKKQIDNMLAEIKDIKNYIDTKLDSISNTENTLKNLINELKKQPTVQYINTTKITNKNDEKVKEKQIPKKNNIKQSTLDFNYLVEQDYLWQGYELRHKNSSFIIQKHYATLGVNSSAEFNIISWNKKKPKYDIRRFESDHSFPRKGITMTEDVVLNLQYLLNNIDIKTLKDSVDKNQIHELRGTEYTLLEKLGGFDYKNGNFEGRYELNITTTKEGNKPIYDFSLWSKDYSSNLQGIKLNQSELTALKKLLNDKF